MMSKHSVALLAMAALFALIMPLAGCATQGGETVIVDSDDVDTLERVEEATVDLLNSTEGLSPDRPIIAATFVNIDDLSESSTLGRMLSETFASQLVRAGQQVIEVKMRDSLFIQEDAGELILSRDIRRLSASHDAQAVLIGTYARAGTAIFVNVRIVRSRDNIILGATSMRLPLNQNIRAMLPAAW